VGISMSIALLVVSYWSPSQEFFLANLMLLIALMLIVYFTLLSKAVKTYFESDE
jgi:hypothetical protein